MHLIERTEVDHPAAKAWPMIVSPEFFQLWNDKVISMEAKERGSSWGRCSRPATG